MTTATTGLTTTKPRRAKGQKFSLFEHGEIIAWDGEGVDTGRLIEDAREHAFTLLANSEGDELYREKGISTSDALKFLTDVGQAHKKAIHVVFGGNYDCNCILRDLTREQLIMALPEKNGSRSVITLKCKSGIYRVQWIPRKQLQISRIALDEHGRRVTQMRAGYRQPVIEARITLWDVFGFFQGSFVSALEKWAPKLTELAIIKRGKAARSQFDQWAREDLTEYNAAELRALVILVDKVRDAIRDLGLTITRWDGAGSIAAAMLKHQGVKAAICDPPNDVQRAAAHAYFGGRIERGQFGVASQVHAYDINSAYPATIATLPDLTHGHWRRIEFPYGAPAGALLAALPRFTVARVKWSYAPRFKYYPFPFRIPDGRVYFPNSGHGWYWAPEVLAACAFEDANGIPPTTRAHVYEAWSFHEEAAPAPWAWVRDYYEQRRAMVMAGQVGGAEIMLKLGINSLYGKTVQTAGYNPDDGRRPPYHNLCLGGYITSDTRAKLFQAVTLDPDAVIMLATDGVFASRPMPIQTRDDKQLGAWGVQVYDDFVSVASGVYFTRKAGKPWQSVCRGYDRTTDAAEIEHRIAEVIGGWQSGAEVIHWPSTRFVGGGSAKVSELQFKRWCCWYEARTKDGIMGRQVQLVPREFKRSYQGRKRPAAHKGLLWTVPAPGQGFDCLSTAYYLPWDVIDANEENDEIEDAGHV
jgi:hypothetical protein